MTARGRSQRKARAKTVPVLGRFTPERRAFFDVVKNELFRRNYVAVSFDFAQPTTRSLSETLTLLAGLSRFIVADLTDARSVPLELAQIIPQLPSVPIVPLIRYGERPFALFDDMFRHYAWVLAPIVYEATEDVDELLNQVVESAEGKISEHMQPVRKIYAETRTHCRNPRPVRRSGVLSAQGPKWALEPGVRNDKR